MAGKSSPASSKWTVFTMPSCVKTFSRCCLLILPLWSFAATASDYSAQIRYADLSHNSSDELQINAAIDYPLSPTAKEALLKGVPLEWMLTVEIRQSGWLWDSIVFKQQLPYKLQFHALLNQYAVQTSRGHSEMFLTLNAALGYMSQPQTIVIFDSSQLKADSDYQLALKTQFLREALPVPLRPFAYLDQQWYLSSNWFLWPIPK
jgi:hypothetical protein